MASIDSEQAKTAELNTTKSIHKTGELKIPTSFGHIAAKTWGEDSENRLRVLAVHGWQDNAGTFDRLFPLLPLEKLYIVAIDLPGHGSSSHLPAGVPYTDMTWVIEIKRTLDYLGWRSNVTIIAHSMGAIASLEVAVLYPELVTNLVMLDTIKPRIFPTDRLAHEMGAAINQFTSSQKSNQFTNRTYTFDLNRAIDVIIQTHFNGHITRDAALCLMHRAVEFRQVGNRQRVTFRRDARLASPVYRKLDARQLLTYLSNIRCRLLIVRARDTHHTLRCTHEDLFLDMYTERCAEFIYEVVDGDHYVHLTNAKTVSPYVVQFLQPLIDKLPK